MIFIYIVLKNIRSTFLSMIDYLVIFWDILKLSNLYTENNCSLKIARTVRVTALANHEHFRMFALNTIYLGMTK